MTVTYPPQPWSEGDKFFNETTLVQYTYNGVAWIAEGGPAPDDGEYLPLTGGDLSGPLNINVNSGTVLSINTNKIKFWSSGAVELNGYTAFKDNELITKKFCDDRYLSLTDGGQITGYVQFKDDTKLQMGGTYNNKIIDGSLGFTDNGYVATLGYVKHQIQALGDSLEGDQVPSSCRKLRFARDKDWNNLRPGEFGLMGKSNNYVYKWSEATQIFFLGVDRDGNRLIRDENMQSWSSFVGSAVTVLTSSGNRPLLRAVPTGQAGGLVMLEWDKESDIFYIGWTEPKCGALMTGTNDNLSNAQDFLFNIPDLFF